MEILETPGRVTVIQEAYNQVRRIYLNEPAIAPEDAEPRYAGNSTARWEGGTLVVSTVGVKESVRFRNVPHSAKMRITERLRLPIVAGGLGHGSGAHAPNEYMVIEPKAGSKIAGLAEVEKFYVDLLYALAQAR